MSCLLLLFFQGQKVLKINNKEKSKQIRIPHFIRHQKHTSECFKFLPPSPSSESTERKQGKENMKCSIPSGVWFSKFISFDSSKLSISLTSRSPLHTRRNKPKLRVMLHRHPSLKSEISEPERNVTRRFFIKMCRPERHWIGEGERKCEIFSCSRPIENDKKGEMKFLLN